jgi:hypothetical protein
MSCSTMRRRRVRDALEQIASRSFIQFLVGAPIL